MSDYDTLAACCPYCDEGPFEDEDDWFEHTAECGMDQPEYPGADEEE